MPDNLKEQILNSIPDQKAKVESFTPERRDG